MKLFNLSVGHFRNGDAIPYCESDEEWLDAARQQKPAWCHSNGNPENESNYGRLYNWYAFTDPRGLVPENVTMLQGDVLLQKVRNAEGLNLPGCRRVDLITASIQHFLKIDRIEFFQFDSTGYWWSSFESTSNYSLKGDIVYGSKKVPINLNSGFYFMEKGNGVSVLCHM
jgi:hypothetical protein